VKDAPNPAFSTASVISRASALFMARGFLEKTILPAFAAAKVMSKRVLFGLAMSTRSMSGRWTRAHQSVSVVYRAPWGAFRSRGEVSELTGS
jgi:hypothetical protein